MSSLISSCWIAAVCAVAPQCDKAEASPSSVAESPLLLADREFEKMKKSSQFTHNVEDDDCMCYTQVRDVVDRLVDVFMHESSLSTVQEGSDAYEALGTLFEVTGLSQGVLLKRFESIISDVVHKVKIEDFPNHDQWSSSFHRHAINELARAFCHLKCTEPLVIVSLTRIERVREALGVVFAKSLAHQWSSIATSPDSSFDVDLEPITLVVYQLFKESKVFKMTYLETTMNLIAGIFDVVICEQRCKFKGKLPPLRLAMICENLILHGIVNKVLVNLEKKIQRKKIYDRLDIAVMPSETNLPSHSKSEAQLVPVQTVTSSEEDPSAGKGAKEPLGHESAFTVLNEEAARSLWKGTGRSRGISPTPSFLGKEFLPIPVKDWKPVKSPTFDSDGFASPLNLSDDEQEEANGREE